MNVGALIVLAILALAALFGIEVFFLWVFLKIFDKELTKKMLIIPAALIVGLIILLILGKLIHPVVFQIFYCLATGIIGFEIHLLFFAIIVAIMNTFQKIPKLYALSILLIPTIAFSLYGFINPWVIKEEKHTLIYKDYPGELKIAHLSDIHLGGHIQKAFIKKIVNKIKKIDPDVVVITGDFADGSMKVKAEWMEPFNDLTIPIYYITGNHEDIHGKDDMLEEVFKTKIQYIGNTTVDYKNVRFVGVDYEYDLEERLTEFSDQGKLDLVTGRPNILLCHIPLIEPKILKKYNIFLFLAGHTHAGQLFPIHIFAYISYPCFHGLYNYLHENFIYVSPGTGFATIPVRTFSNGVVAIITIKGNN